MSQGMAHDNTIDPQSDIAVLGREFVVIPVVVLDFLRELSREGELRLLTLAGFPAQRR